MHKGRELEAINKLQRCKVSDITDLVFTVNIKTMNTDSRRHDDKGFMKNYMKLTDDYEGKKIFPIKLFRNYSLFVHIYIYDI
uniref:Uncharacterized protein n=1 Tax=Octopus bimaculoides TaxID=37653 RepID=A0A0L8GHK3_OCTBM